MEIIQELRKGAVHAAPLLLGYELVHKAPEGTTTGYIVEVEAYTQDDPASHTFKGETLRNDAMFKDAGTIYIYFIYGAHYCMNIVASIPGRGEALLIRALQPMEGVELMKQRRKTTDERQLTNGPAKLVQAMGISKALDGTRIDEGELLLKPGMKTVRVVASARIGISKAVDVPWRFCVADNPYVSR